MSNTAALIAIIVVLALVGAFAFGRKHIRARARGKGLFGADPQPGGTVDPARIFIGPVGHFGDKSPGVPDHPVAAPGGGFAFDVPVRPFFIGGDRVGYVGFRHGPLTGYVEVRLRLYVEIVPGEMLFAVPEQEDETSPAAAQVSLFIQKVGDDWDGIGADALARWRRPMGYLRQGWNEFWVRLERVDGWAGMIDTPGTDADFAALLASDCNLGICFGGNARSYGHGMAATGRARVTVAEFDTVRG